MIGLRYLLLSSDFPTGRASRFDFFISKLKNFLGEEVSAGKTIYPPKDSIFAAYNLCPLPAVRVVIIGQDPYHGPGQVRRTYQP